MAEDLHQPECKAEVRRFPAAYSWPERPEKSKTGDLPSDASRPPRSAHLKGVKSALRGVSEKPSPPFRCLREWRWEADADYDEHRLYNRDGKLAARLWGVGDHWYLLHPKTTPLQSAVGLEAAKRLAVSMALASLPLDEVTAARIKRENEKPHPMGPPLNRPPTLGDVLPSAGSTIAIKHRGPWSDDLSIPAFLRRTAKSKTERKVA